MSMGPTGAVDHDQCQVDRALRTAAAGRVRTRPARRTPLGQAWNAVAFSPTHWAKVRAGLPVTFSTVGSTV